MTQFTPEIFTSDYWQQQQAITGTAQGRGTTYFIRQAEQNWVLRHYYRGGLIGKINHDSYLYTGINNTRAAKEFQLLKTMTDLGLPVPKPVGFCIVKHGLFYQADIITNRIAQATDLVALLTEQSISHQLWQAIGHCISQFHQQGIYHHDLNAHNILIDSNNKVWLIDFDQGKQQKPHQSWQQGNMQRLLRSFEKECNKIAGFHFQQSCWQALIASYEKGLTTN